jgi:hypothetical protein
MRKFDYFNLQLPTVEQLRFDSVAKEIGIRRRWTDRTVWGIMRSNAYPAVSVIPVSAVNVVPNYAQNILQAPVSLDTATGLVGVGLGSDPGVNPAIVGLVAYDLNGQRIAIEQDEDFEFDNNVAYGHRSSGNRNIPLAVGASSGNASTVAPVPGTYYLWVTYLEANENVPVVDKLGAIHYPYIDDGYRIQLTTSPVAPDGDGQSIFLCKITWAPGFTGILTVTDGQASNGSGQNILDTAPIVSGDPRRVYCGIKSQDVEIALDAANKTIVYQDGLITSLAAHVNAMGAGTPTPDNPHAIALINIPGAGSEPTATTNQADSLAKGIIDLNAPQNSPNTEGDALQPEFGQGSLAPTSPLDPNSAAVGVTTTVKDRWVRILDLDTLTKTKAVYVGGHRLRQLYPNLRQSDKSGDPSVIPTDPLSGDGWIGFNDTEDATGYYYLYGQYGTLVSGGEVLFLGKSFEGAVITDPVLSDNQILIGRVYWDASGALLYRNATGMVVTDPGNEPDDQRSLGLVGPQQLSSETKNDPITGALAGTATHNNLVANSGYALGLRGTTQDGLSPTGVFAVGSFTQVDTGTEPALASQANGPAALFGLKAVSTAGPTATGSVRHYHALANLLPDRLYSVSWYMKATAGFNLRLRVGLVDSNGSTPTSLATVDAADITVRNDGLYRRYTAIFQMKDPSFVDPDFAVPKFLMFQFDRGVLDSTGGNIFLANVMVNQGEWVPAYRNAREVPSGGIIEWDLSTTCPEGYEEVTDARDRFTVGANGNVAPGAFGGTAFDPSGAAITTSAVAGHSHSNVGPTPVASGTGADRWNSNNSSTTDGGHDHTLNLSATLPYYGVIKCRAI